MDNYDNYDNENGDDRVKPYSQHWWMDFLYIAGIVGLLLLGFWLSRL